MGRKQQIIETIECDVCGKEVKEALAVTLGWDRSQWEIDLCPADHKVVSAEFDSWIAGGRKVRAARQQKKASTGSDWDYLESLGFKRHRGRKTNEELAALEARR